MTTTSLFDLGVVYGFGPVYTLRTLGRAAHGTRRHVVVVDGNIATEQRRYTRALCGVQVQSLTSPGGGVTCQRCKEGA